MKGTDLAVVGAVVTVWMIVRMGAVRHRDARMPETANARASRPRVTRDKAGPDSRGCGPRTRRR